MSRRRLWCLLDIFLDSICPKKYLYDCDVFMASFVDIRVIWKHKDPKKRKRE